MSTLFRVTFRRFSVAMHGKGAHGGVLKKVPCRWLLAFCNPRALLILTKLFNKSLTLDIKFSPKCSKQGKSIKRLENRSQATARKGGGGGGREGGRRKATTLGAPCASLARAWIGAWGLQLGAGDKVTSCNRSLVPASLQQLQFTQLESEVGGAEGGGAASSGCHAVPLINDTQFLYHLRVTIMCAAALFRSVLPSPPPLQPFG